MARNLKHQFIVPEHFTQEHKSMMEDLWQEIGYDVIELEGGSAHGEIVVEFILDAGRLEALSDRVGGTDKLDWAAFRKQPYEDQVSCARTVFPFTWYTL